MKFLMFLLTALMFVVRRRVLYDAGSAAARIYHAQNEFGAKNATEQTTNYALSMLTSANRVCPSFSVMAAAPPVVASSGGVSYVVVFAGRRDASDAAGGTQVVPSFPAALFISQHCL